MRRRETELLGREDDLREAAQGSLHEFFRQAWHTFDPNPLIDNWHLGVVSDHLEAVSLGQIQRLMINVPFRTAKSTLVSVAWPAWDWIKSPERQFMSISHAERLSVRDTRKMRRCVQSRWYQARWPIGFAVDQNQKSLFENDSGGRRLAMGIDSGIIGEGANVIICLRGDAEITTDHGKIEIGRIVENELPVRVLSSDSFGRVRWSEIQEYEKSIGRKSVHIKTGNRELVCTHDHPVYVVGRGYVDASLIIPGEKVVIHGENLPDMRKRNSQVRGEVLFEEMLLQVTGYVGDGWMSGVRKAGDSLESSRKKGESWRDILLTQMSWPLAERGKQSSVHWRKAGYRVPSVRESVSRRPVEIRQDVVFCRVPDCFDEWSRWSSSKGKGGYSVRDLWGSCSGNPGKASEAVLWSGVCGAAAQQEDDWQGEWSVRAWKDSRNQEIHELPAWIQGYSQEGKGERLPPMSHMRDDERRAQDSAACPSHRLRRNERCDGKLDNDVPVLSRSSSWFSRREKGLGEEVVRSVEICATPQVVYNVRVEPNHNYFANGILVHNCDDIVDRKDARNVEQLRKVQEVFSEEIETRLNNPVDDSIVLVMQRLHEDDPSGYCLREGGWEHLCLPMEYSKNHRFPSRTSLGFVDPRTKEDELLFEARFPHKTVEGYKRNRFFYSGQCDQDPVPRGGGQFRREWFESNIVKAVPAIVSDRARGWDIGATADDGDFTAGVKVSRDADGIYYIEDVKRGQWSSMRRDRIMRSTAESDGDSTKVSVPQDPGAAGKSLAQSHVKLLAGYTVVVTRPRGTKSSRAEAFESQCEVGNVKLVAGDWNEVFMTEFEQFPGGSHDDQVDATCDAFDLISKPEEVVIDPQTIRYYEQSGANLSPLDKTGKSVGTINQHDCFRFAVVFPASADKQKSGAIQSTWSVALVIDYWREMRYGLIANMARGKPSYEKLKSMVRQIVSDLGVSKVIVVESEVGGRLFSDLRFGGADGAASVDVEISAAWSDPLEGSTYMQQMLERSELFIPRDDQELRELIETHWMSFSGKADQEGNELVIATSHAARYMGLKGQSWGGAITTRSGKLARDFAGDSGSPKTVTEAEERNVRIASRSGERWGW